VPDSSRVRPEAIPLFSLALALLAGTTLLPQLRGETSRELTTVHDIRALSSEEAGHARPVRLHGVVTVLSGWKSSFFFQDATSGISVDRSSDAPKLQPGEVVEIEGVTGSGLFAPVVVANKVTVLGGGKMPPARLFSRDKLAGGAEDSQWLAIRGIVRSAVVRPSWGRQVLFLEVDIGGGDLVAVRVHDFSDAGLDRLPASTVTIRGVCGTVFNDKRQFVGLRLFVSNLNDVKAERLAPADPFGLPLRPLGALMQFGDRQGAVNRVKVQGIVTYYQPGEGLFILDGSQGAFVQSRQTTSVAAGSRVEAVGYPAAGGYSPRIVDAVFRVIGMAQPPAGEPRVASGMIVQRDGFAAAPYDSALVRLQGVLVEAIPGVDEDVLLLRDGATNFSAKLPHSGQAQTAPELGSLLSVTGICVAQADNAYQVRSFELLLRSPADLVVIRKAPWWSPAHAKLVVVAALIVVVLLMSAWMAMLRRQIGLRALTLTDPLTGIYNRRGFLLLAGHQWELTQRKNSSLLLFYIDVDRFKEINDSLGHKEGDLALQAVAAVLRESFRRTDVVGRLGGDEFVVIAVDARRQSQAHLQARIAELTQQSNRKPGRNFQLSLSVGVLNCDESLSGSTIEDLLARADTLMYEQKRERKTRVLESLHSAATL
jgi:diguanylate cyclase (GGDEF)-like protein